MISIIGAKGLIDDVDVFLSVIKSLSEKYDLVIQVFNADLIYGKDHLLSSYEHAKRAVNRKLNITKSLGMELLLYASGERQIKKALDKIGIKKNSVNLAILIHGRSISEGLINKILQQLKLTRSDMVLDGDIETLYKFGLPKEEIQTVSNDKYGDLILEKVANVDLIK
jgi:KEOPS complex subunit Cgi121